MCPFSAVNVKKRKNIRKIFIVVNVSVSVSIASIRGILTEHSPRPSVSLLVGLSVMWVILEKWLIGYGCCLGFLMGSDEGWLY